MNRRSVENNEFQLRTKRNRKLPTKNLYSRKVLKLSFNKGNFQQNNCGMNDICQQCHY